MKIKSLIGATVAAVALATSMGSASAAQITSETPVLSSTFNDLVIGTIDISSLSNLTGAFFAANSLNYQIPFTSTTVTLTLQPVTFSSGSVGTLTDLDSSASSFSFQNVGIGSYVVKASGSLTGIANIQNVAFLGASYSVTAVPEPETFAMLLAGLGMMGSIAMRRNKKTNV